MNKDRLSENTASAGQARRNQAKLRSLQVVNEHAEPGFNDASPSAVVFASSKQRGFTLIEIMVVVVILGILAALVVPQVMGRPDQAKVTAAQNDIRAIGAALDMYKLDNQNYPSTQQGLEALVKKPTGNPPAKNWNAEGYLKKLPIDPWGNQYLYLSPGTRGKIDLYSLGADGQEGGDGTNADIGNWDI
ncbi:type II secretion system major pseudopilin GspG [Pseudomonas sp. PDM16]|nr:type II secretion system major pseudopilin GspG [Pseudomonas sp. PDM16]